MAFEPTREQLDIIGHDLNRHATVLAVAGSGKTSTMVHRVRYLLENGVPAAAIRAVMYNTSARVDFETKLKAAGLSGVTVQTFHAVGYSILNWAVKQRLTPSVRLVVESRELNAMTREAIRLAAIDSPEAKLIKAEDLLGAISVWKAMLTPPEEALHLDGDAMVDSYTHFERLRNENRLITFDDQIYEAVRLLDRSEQAATAMSNRLEHLIIDEFQDVNYARLRLARIIAGERAKVTVVGDDDQCIYEWQGARSWYIKRGFETDFTHYPHTRYKLTRSFRYGPLIAQVAANVIGHNTDRDKKDLVANDLLQPAMVTVDTDSCGGGGRQILPRLQSLFDEGVMPANIAVVVRKYSQSFFTQSLLLARRIPFFVDGDTPFLNAHPVRVAIDYLVAAGTLDSPLDIKNRKIYSRVVHKPTRFVKKEIFNKLLADATESKISAAEVLLDVNELLDAGINNQACGHLRRLEGDLRAALDASMAKGGTAAPALSELIGRVNFSEYFESFETADSAKEDLAMMDAFLDLLEEADVPLTGLLSFLESMDSKAGQPDDQCIRITSVFKAKGLEWDHVFMPDLTEGQSPDLRPNNSACGNRKDPSRAADATQTLESERRLFYVAVTRARKSLHLFADHENAAKISRFLHEAAISQTQDAVDALQRLLRHPESPEVPLRILEAGASGYHNLQQGLLNMLAQASQDCPDDNGIATAIALLHRIRQVPFSYPHAYPSVTEKAKPRAWESGTGLPF